MEGVRLELIIENEQVLEKLGRDREPWLEVGRADGCCLCTFQVLGDSWKDLELSKRYSLMCILESSECTGLGEDWRQVGHLAGIQMRADMTLN